MSEQNKFDLSKDMLDEVIGITLFVTMKNLIKLKKIFDENNITVGMPEELEALLEFLNEDNDDQPIH